MNSFEHPNYALSQMEVNNRRVVNFNQYSGIAANERIYKSAAASPNERSDERTSPVRVRAKSASISRIKGSFSSPGKIPRTQVDNYIYSNSPKITKTVDYNSVIESDDGRTSPLKDNTSETEDVYLQALTLENSSMQYSNFAEIEGGDYPLHSSTLWLLEQATSAAATAPGASDGIIFFHSPKKSNAAKKDNQQQEIGNSAMNVKKSKTYSNLFEFDKEPTKNVSKLDFDFDLSKPTKHVSPYLVHLEKKSTKGRRLMSAPTSRSHYDLAQPEQSNQNQQGKSSNKGSDRMIRSAQTSTKVDIDDQKQHYLPPVITIASTQKEMPKVFGIVAADDIHDLKVREKTAVKEESFFIETPHMLMLANDYSKAGSPKKISKPLENPLTPSVSSLFFPTSPSSRQKSPTKNMSFSFDWKESDPASPILRSKQLDKSWQMDPNFVSHHTQLIASIVNPAFAEKRYRACEDTRSAGVGGQKAQPVPRRQSYHSSTAATATATVTHLSHSDPLYKLLIDEIPNVRTSFQLFEELSVHRAGDSPRLAGDIPQHSKPLPHTTGKKITKQKQQRTNAFRVSPADLKMLSSFNVLPPEMWVTARIVYFLFLVYFQMMIKEEETSSKIRGCLSIEALWTVLGEHVSADSLSGDSVEKKFTWSLLQALLCYPIMFSKALLLIEHGPADFLLAEEQQCLKGKANQGPQEDVSLLSSGRNIVLRYLFYDKFPLSMLGPLRRLVVSGLALFDQSSLIHTVPAGAKLCCWARRVIANIFASCWHRDNRHLCSNTQSLTDIGDDEYEEEECEDVRLQFNNTVTSLITSTEEDVSNAFSYALTQPTFPHLSFVAHIQMESTASSSIDSLAWNTAFIWAMKVTRPTDQLDVVLSPPVKSHPNKKRNSLIGIENHQGTSELNDDVVEMVRKYYEKCLQYHSASPLHRAIPLKSIGHVVDNLPYTSHEILKHTEFITSHNKHISNHNNKNSINGSVVLIVDMPQGRLPRPLLHPKDTTLSGSQIPSFPFSLLLSAVPDMYKAASHPTNLHYRDVPLLQESAGLNYVVCVNDSKKSWEAYQMACLMMKPLDKIIVLHIPLLEDLESGDEREVRVNEGVHKGVDFSEDTHRFRQSTLSGIAKKTKARKSTYLSKEMYALMAERAMMKADHIVSFYKNAGVNVMVDELPSFLQEAERKLRSGFNKTSIENVMGSSVMLAPTLFEYDMTRENILDQEVVDICKIGIANMSKSFSYNQDRRYLSQRINEVVLEQSMEPCVLVLGVKTEDIYNVLSGSAAENRQRSADLWSVSFGNQLVDERQSNTFLTESQPHLTASTVIFLSESQPTYQASDDYTDTEGPIFKENIALPSASSVTVDDIYCYTERKIGLVEHLLSTSDSYHGIGNTQSKKTSIINNRAYLLAQVTPASKIEYAQ